MSRVWMPVPFLAWGCVAATEPKTCGADAEKELVVGRCAPEFDLPDRYGQAFTLSSMRGKVALVDISAVW